MLEYEFSLPIWLAVPVLVLAVLGARAYVIDPLVKKALVRRERDLKARLNSTLTRPLPKMLQAPRRVLMERLLADPVLREAIEIEALKNGHDKAEETARRYVDEMMPSFYALFYFRIGYWIARRWLQSVYEIKIVKQLPPDAFADIPQDTSIVLVANHRSNLDVAVLCYLAARTSMISFAAGEWASVWPVNRVIQMSGCYIIRRQAQSRLYKVVLARYMNMMINAHMPQGIFLEGGLSRDGAIQPIKLGLIRYILSSLGSDGVRDIAFIPVAFNYDRVPEDITLLAHQEKGFRQKSRFYTIKSTALHSFGVIMRLLRVQRRSYGHAAVSFGQAFSVAEWLETQGLSVDQLDDKTRKDIVAPVAENIIGQIGQMIPILPVSLAATVLCKANGETFSLGDFNREVQDLVDRLRAKDAPLTFDEEDDLTASERGLKVLTSRSVVRQRGGEIHLNPDKKLLLNYYARTISHFLADQGEEDQLHSILAVKEPAVGEPEEKPLNLLKI